MKCEDNSCVCFLQTNSKYEVMGEVRPQLKFLEEVDRLEKKRHEEVEREVLLRAARVGVSCWSIRLGITQLSNDPTFSNFHGVFCQS